MNGIKHAVPPGKSHGVEVNPQVCSVVLVREHKFGECRDGEVAAFGEELVRRQFPYVVVGALPVKVILHESHVGLAQLALKIAHQQRDWAGCGVKERMHQHHKPVDHLVVEGEGHHIFGALSLGRWWGHCGLDLSAGA